MISAAPARAAFFMNIACCIARICSSRSFQNACMMGVIESRKPRISSAPRSAQMPSATESPPTRIVSPLSGTSSSGAGAP
jgi:hypothetical protein